MIKQRSSQISDDFTGNDSLIYVPTVNRCGPTTIQSRCSMRRNNQICICYNFLVLLIKLACNFLKKYLTQIIAIIKNFQSHKLNSVYLTFKNVILDDFYCIYFIFSFPNPLYCCFKFSNLSKALLLNIKAQKNILFIMYKF